MSHFKPSIICGHIKTPKIWLIDMDDTLYSASANMFRQIDSAMTQYIQNVLKSDYDCANALRMKYWQTYGVTYFGLWKHHGIDPHTFLTTTHKFIDTTNVNTTGDLKKALSQLPGKKILFTNAPDCFADKILEQLDLTHFFDAQYRAEDMKVFGHWRPKPSAQMFRKILTIYKVKPQEVCLIDDGLNNLRTAKSVGLQTVLCKGWHHHGLSTARTISYVDGQISHIRDIPRILYKSKAVERKHKRPVFLDPFN